jgi:hypothetical protein
MKRIWREMLFWVFVALFFTLAPTILLYTAGYRYQFGSGRFLRTGVLSISTTPRNATITLDGEREKMQTPAVLKHVFPGTYTVVLSRSGYHDWTGDIDIQESQTTYLTNILLFLERTPEIVSQEDIATIAIHPTNQSILYAIHAGAVTQVWEQDPERQKPVLLLEQAKDENLALSWSAEGNYLLIDSVENHLFTTSGDRIEIRDEGDWFFDTFDDALMYQDVDGEITQLNLASRDYSRVEQTDTFSLFQSSSLTLFDNGQNTELRKQGRSQELITILPRADYTILSFDAPYLLLERNETDLLLLDVDATDKQLLETEAIQWDWNAETNELAYTDGHEVMTYEASNGHQELITRQSQEIQAVHWLPEGTHLVLLTKEAITIMEQFPQAKQRTFLRVAQQSGIGESWLSDDGNTLYFLANEPTTRLMRLDLRK